MKQLTVMLERTADGAMVVEKEGKSVLWNRVAERLLGFKAHEVVGHFCRDEK
jgi:PAS domain S-box-containing protein